MLGIGQIIRPIGQINLRIRQIIITSIKTKAVLVLKQAPASPAKPSKYALLSTSTKILSTFRVLLSTFEKILSTFTHLLSNSPLLLSTLNHNPLQPHKKEDSPRGVILFLIMIHSFCLGFSFFYECFDFGFHAFFISGLRYDDADLI